MSKGPKGEGKRELWFWLRTWCVISTGDPGGTNPSGFVGGTMGNLFYWTQGPLKIFNRFSSVIQTILPGCSLILRGQTNRDLAHLLSTIGASIINICALVPFICFILYCSFLWISHNIYIYTYFSLFLHVSHIFATFPAGNPQMVSDGCPQGSVEVPGRRNDPLRPWRSTGIYSWDAIACDCQRGMVRSPT